MPPKKKKSGKKKKGGKKSGKKSAKPASQTEQLSELSKEFYLIQIRDLEQRLEKYQKKCDELEVAKVDYETQLKTHIDDKKSVTSYLKKNLETRGDEIQDLNDRLTGLQQAKDAEKDTYEAQLQQVRTDFQEMKDQLTSENMILGGKLASLEEFKVQKEDLMAKMQALDDSLKQKDVDHQDQIYLLERKQVVDKDRLKKEMVMRVNQVAAEFRKVSNKQMAETTKRTIRENVSINAQLAKMSDKTMEMIGENDELRLRDKQQRQQIELLETNEKELAKKNHSNQKIIRMLTEKCKSQEAMLAEYEMREEQYQELEQENELFRTQVENSRTEAATLSRDNEALEEELARLRGDLAETRANKNKLEKVLRDAAGALKQALRPTTSEDADESPYDVVEKRDSMLENLLVLLNSAAALGVGPAPREFGANRATTPKPRLGNMSPMPGSGKGIRKGEMSSSLSAGSRGGAGGIPHYQLGDLGLIPRPTQHLPSHLDKMKELSATTRLGTLKKVLTRSVAVQTVSAPKAMFFADQMLTKLPPGSTAMIHELDNQHQKRTSKVF